MTAAWVPLATTTLSSSATSVTFSSIPQGYRDLIVVINGKGSIDENPTYTINGSTANFNWVRMSGNGSTTVSDSNTNNTIGRMGTGETSIIAQFFDYSATDKHKTFLIRNDYTAGDLRGIAARWASTAAINSLSFGIRLSGSYLTGTTFSLYGSNKL